MLRLNKPLPPYRLNKKVFEDLQDLQVAAELGRTLLERNEELENDVKSQQAIIDDQAQEIEADSNHEFLTKQNNAMKEENVTRAKFYEQLEATVFELERTNTTLTRKHDSDRKRIQSLCENIDYLERKCEEMTGTLATIRDESKKQYGAGKMSRNNYWSSNGSDSSEDDSFFFYKRRSHSLHDLRDYTPSPDEFDTHNSNSPDLKASEMEFIESLESKIEELISSKKKELDKVHQMESQMRMLLQENASLQEQLNEVQTEKEDEIHELRKQLLDTSNYAQQTLSLSTRLSLQARHGHGRDNHCPGTTSDSSSPLSLSSLPETSAGCSSSSRSSNSSNNADGDDPKSHSKHSPAFLDYPSPNTRSTVLCKRCSAEINLLSLVNSIEVENDDSENLDVGEFSSLEHELARATGNHTLDSFGDKRHHHGSYPNPEGSGRFHNWGLKRPSLLDYFLFGRDEEIGEEACETEVDGAVMSTLSGSKSRCTADDDDEDPCLRKDRQSEKQKVKLYSPKGCDSTSSQIPVKKLKLPVKIPFDEEVNEMEIEKGCSSELRLRSTQPNVCGSSSDTHRRHDQCDINDSSEVTPPPPPNGDESVTSSKDSKSSVSATKPSKSKQKTGFFWWLAWLIMLVLGVFECLWTLVTLLFFVATAAILPKSCSSTLLALSSSRFLRPVRFLEPVSIPFVFLLSTPSNPSYVRGQDEVGSEKTQTEETVLPPVSVYLTPPSENDEMEDEDELAATLMMQELENTPFLSSTHILLDKTMDEHLDWQSQQQPGVNSNVPEYKQILLKMFNLFHNSRSTYPAPVYPIIAEARR
ncbi:unnamed protein product [Allacma fusca]|uniref:Uncharacterized protein n=1 Tax=Allacma fusca TaxID=39272 RepID=A0A8J2LGK1_9HEXA|nr:unnamed protein product [Allacma fusca]